MMAFILKTSEALPFVVLSALFPLIHLLRARGQRKDARNFANAARETADRVRSFELIRVALLTLSCVLFVVALARPAWDKEPHYLKGDGRDVVFVLDVSNSMLAQDLAPNRLGRSKVAIRECVDSFANHRVGLVAFAGSAHILCPLTQDYDFFYQRLDEASPLSADQGGTRIEDALLKAADKLFSGRVDGYKDIILISDGGDHGGDASAAVAALNEKGIRLICIGIGDDTTGSRIPDPENDGHYITYAGQEVWTKLESSILGNLAASCESGVYLPVKTRNMYLSQIYDQLSARHDNRKLSEKSIMVYKEKFQLFLILGLIFLVLSRLIPRYIRRAAGALVVIMILLQPAQAEDLKPESAPITAIDAYNQGNAAYMKASFDEARGLYDQALRLGGNANLRSRATYNLANTLFKLAESAELPDIAIEYLDSSIRYYRTVLLQCPDNRDAAVNLELSHMKRRDQMKIRDAEQKRQDELKRALQELRKQLEQLVANQAAALAQTREVVKSKMVPTRELIKKEESVNKGALTSDEFAKSIIKEFFAGVPEEFMPLADTVGHLDVAGQASATASRQLREKTADAPASETKALEALQAALQSVPDADSAEKDGVSTDQQDGEGESDDLSDDFDESSDDDGDVSDNNSSGNSQGLSKTLKIDLSNQEIPLPNDSAKDILKEYERIQEMREAKKSGQREEVEKNW